MRKVTRFTRNAMCIETATAVYVGSYRSLVCSLDKRTGRLTRYWGGYSPSTMNHIRKTACASIGYKDAWESMPVKAGGFSPEEIQISRYIEQKGHEGTRDIWDTLSGRSYAGGSPVSDPLTRFMVLSRA